MNKPTCGRGRLEVVGVSPTRCPGHCGHYSKHSLPDSKSILACYITPKSTPNRIRTCDPRLRRPLLYPAELSGLIYNSQCLRCKYELTNTVLIIYIDYCTLLAGGQITSSVVESDHHTDLVLPWVRSVCDQSRTQSRCNN